MTEVFPHEFTWHAVDTRTGRENTGRTRYRFVPIPTPTGWRTYPGQQCHDGQDGLLIEDSPSRWSEEDLWGAHNKHYFLNIGCYGGVKKYICHAHTPDWHGKRLAREEFDTAEEAAAWAIQWMNNPPAISVGLLLSE